MVPCHLSVTKWRDAPFSVRTHTDLFRLRYVDDIGERAYSHLHRILSQDNLLIPATERGKAREARRHVTRAGWDCIHERQQQNERASYHLSSPGRFDILNFSRISTLCIISGWAKVVHARSIRRDLVACLANDELLSKLWPAETKRKGTKAIVRTIGVRWERISTSCSQDWKNHCRILEPRIVYSLLLLS